jgi:hypothetical protein
MPVAQESAEAKARRSSLSALVRLVLAPSVWALHLGAVYGGHTVLCAVWGRQGAHPAAAYWLIAVATAAALAVLAASTVGLHAARRQRTPASVTDVERFRHRLAVLLAILSAIAIAWTGAAAVVIPACIAA